MIFIENVKKKRTTLLKLYPEAKFVDVTSKSLDQFVKLSPFYPHGKIPVPFSDRVFSYSVEGIWQGLKVFNAHDIDTRKFLNKTMSNLKRTIKKFGLPIGHRKGVNGEVLLNYPTARKLIFAPTYYWMLENKANVEIEKLIQIAKSYDVVLLDFDTNWDMENIKKPLSHASLIKTYIELKHPELVEKRFHFSKNVKKNKKIKTVNETSRISDADQLRLNF
jgi:hypothetical protein